MSNCVHVFLIVDAARVPACATKKLRDGAVLSLGSGADKADDCFVASIVIQCAPDHMVCASLCRLCPEELIGISAAYEHAEALAVRHLRQKHSIYSALWQYDDKLKVHPIF